MKMTSYARISKVYLNSSIAIEVDQFAKYENENRALKQYYLGLFHVSRLRGNPAKPPRPPSCNSYIHTIEQHVFHAAQQPHQPTSPFTIAIT